METIKPGNIFRKLSFYLADWNTLNDEYPKIDWNSYLTDDLQVDEMLSSFLKLVSCICVKHIPFKKSKRHKSQKENEELNLGGRLN